MLRNNKWTLIITSLIILLPMAAGLLLWDKLPDNMVTHWDASGTADGMGSKAFAVFGMPGIMLALQWLCVLLTSADPKSKGQSRKVTGMVLWIVPLISTMVCTATYLIALDAWSDFSLIRLIAVLMAVMFLVMGNYLPKTKRNPTIGIKLAWTLGNDEVWNKTHRLSGKVWMICGLVMLAAVFLPVKILVIVSLVVFALMLIIPLVYSYAVYRKMVKSGEYTEDISEKQKKYNSVAGKIVLVVMPLIFIALGIIMFTGDVEVSFGEDAFVVNASYYDDISVEYDEIDRAVYREDIDIGMRSYGFASARLLLGNFENDEFGKYTLYGYAGSESWVVLESSDGRILLICGESAQETQELYEAILERIGENAAE